MVVFVFTEATDYPRDLFFLGAVLATVGSAVALFAPLDDLRGSAGPVGAHLEGRFVLGSVAFIAMIAWVSAIAAGSGAS